MNKTGSRRSILVPIDLYGINRDTLETLVRIAHLLDRKVLGLLIEDIRLQQVADLPFTTEITLDSGRERNLLRHQLLQRHNVISAQARRQLQELAVSHQVELSFEDVCGDRWPSALERDGHQDIFLPPRTRWTERAQAAHRQHYRKESKVQGCARVACVGRGNQGCAPTSLRCVRGQGLRTL